MDKLVPASVDLSKLSDVVKKDVVKKYVYSAKIKDIEDKIPDITNLVTNITKNKIPIITNLATTAALIVKINEVKNNIHDISNLATNTVLTAV